jgi:hypothetical protein
MKIIRETYSKWSTLIQTVTVEGTTLKKLATKYNATIEANGKSFVLDRDGLTVIYKIK